MEVLRFHGSFDLLPTAEMKSFVTLVAFTYSNPEISEATSNSHENVTFTVSASINKLHGRGEYIVDLKNWHNWLQGKISILWVCKKRVVKKVGVS